MAIEVRLPELEEGITGASVTEVLVKPGDMVKPETGVIEVETEKAAIGKTDLGDFDGVYFGVRGGGAGKGGIVGEVQEESWR